MAFYLVTDSAKNEFGESDMFVVRASGTRQAVKLAGVSNAKDATVERLTDGRDVENGIVLASFVDMAAIAPANDYDSSLVEPEATEDPYASYSF